MIFWLKYGTQADIRFPMVKRGVVDLAVGADWTPAAADSAISKDGGNFADTTNTVAILGGSPTRAVTGWKLTLSATEMQCAECDIQIIDAATKAVEDQFLTVYTFGNASAKFAGDWSDLVRLGLTALPNAVFGATGGLGAGVIRGGTAQAGANGSITLDAGASAVDAFYTDELVRVISGTGAGQTRLISGYTGSSKVATVVPNWATNPDNTSVFAVIDAGQADLGLWSRAAPAALSTSGYVQSILLRWLTDNAGGTPNALISGRNDVNVQAMAAGVIGSGVISSGQANDLATALLDLANGVETGITLRQSARAWLASLAGVLSGAATTTVTIKTPDGLTTRIVATVDSNGNRSAIVLTL